MLESTGPSPDQPLLVGMVHLPPLPGSPRHELGMDAILDRARRDAAALAEAGFDGLIVENFGDAPFYPGSVPPETVACLTRAVSAARLGAPDLPVGVNVLRNDGRAAVGIAAATGARFVRINVLAGTMWTDQGPITGQAHDLVRIRRTLAPHCLILADVQVKHAVPVTGRALRDEAHDLWTRAGADALIVSGGATGDRTAVADVEVVREASSGAPLFVGSGVSPDQVGALLSAGATGFIVGSWLQRDGQAGAGIDPERARLFVDAARREMGG